MMHSQTARAPKAHDAGVRARDRTGFALNVALKLAYLAVILGAWLWHAPRYAGCVLLASINNQE